MSAQAETKIRPNPDVIGQRLGDEFILIHLRTNRMYELNSTAARIWELLEEGCDPADIPRRILDEFDADEAALGGEIAALLSYLQKENLIAD